MPTFADKGDPPYSLPTDVPDLIHVLMGGIPFIVALEKISPGEDVFHVGLRLRHVAVQCCGSKYIEFVSGS